MSEGEHRERINAAAQELIAQGYIEETEGPDGELIWTLTSEGRDYLARLQEMDSGSQD